MATVKPISKLNHFTGITVKDLLAKMPKDAKEILAKTILGEATEISKRKGPDGVQTFEGLMGTFRGVFTDGVIEESNVLFLPDEIMAKFLAPFKTDKPVKALDIAVEIRVVRAANAEGYQWDIKPLLSEPFIGADPIERVLAKLKSKNTAAQSAKK